MCLKYLLGSPDRLNVTSHKTHARPFQFVSLSTSHNMTLYQ